MNIVTRAGWGARAPRSLAFVERSQRTEFFTHYLGDGTGPSDHSQCPGYVRGVQNYHMDDNGWADIGYNYITCKHGTVYQGRGIDVIGAHCPNHNTIGFGCCILVGSGDRTIPAIALAAQRDLYDYLCRLTRPLTMLGHRDRYQTDCPGDPLYNWVHSGMPRGLPGSGGDNRFDGWPTLSEATNGKTWDGHVYWLQYWLNMVVVPGWTPITIDGWFGDKTDGAVKQYQTNRRLTVDGIVGPITWADLDRLCDERHL